MADPARRLPDPSAPNDPDVETAFQAVPDTEIAEILDGELYLQPRPARPHTRAATVLGTQVAGPFDLGAGGPGGWVILFEPEIHLGPRPDKLVPDLAGWRRERLPDAIGGDDAPTYYDLSPDWACEVVSPRSEARDRVTKMRIYRREGVAHVWLVNPIARTLEVYRLEGGRYVQIESFEGDEAVRAEPFDAIELALGVLWRG